MLKGPISSFRSLKELIQAMEQGKMRCAMQSMPTQRGMYVQRARPLRVPDRRRRLSVRSLSSSRGVVRELMERAPPDKLHNEIEDTGFLGMISWHSRSQVLPPPVCHLGHVYVCMYDVSV
jgi:hypothetical protein